MLLPPDPQLNQVMARILKGPLEGDLFTGFRTILPADADVTANNVGGVAVVNFPNDVFDGISPNDQRLVFGQIVLTMTSQPGVGQVRFTQGEEPMSVFLGNGSSSAATQSVLASDYTNLLGGSGEPIQTTTTTITTLPSTDPPATATTET
jgi:spore germination protein GerM